MAEKKNPKYTYLVIRKDYKNYEWDSGSPDYINDTEIQMLREYGEKGWELSNIIRGNPEDGVKENSNYFYYYFKQPLTQKLIEEEANEIKEKKILRKFLKKEIDL